MANYIDNVSVKGLRATHFEQLESYVRNAENSGVYYGNKAQFDKRHKEIKKWLRDVIAIMRDPNNVIAK